jgi:acetylornithine deacetylase/succinyl-diaminopimelate desuccinylase-like protein
VVDFDEVSRFVDALWDRSAVPALVDYVKIPNKSPAFDPDWEANGHMEAAVSLFEGWARDQLGAFNGARVEVVRLEGRTPVILIETPGAAEGTVLLYGHLDKQPEMTGWSEGLGPWTPVIRDERLYGRGGADDGYALFGALGALLALREQGAPHARCLILIEACEESGSYDLPAYVDHLAARIGDPSLVVCLDSGCGTYDQLWLTTSLRGMVAGVLEVTVLQEGVHSGDASGVVASSFRILRSLLSRIEDERDGAILLEGLQAPIPEERRRQAAVAAQALGEAVYVKFPFTPGMRPVSEDLVELILNRTWRPALAAIGLDGMPDLASAGNVLRPATALKLSLRLPPTLDAEAAADLLKTVLEADPPYGARVAFTPDKAASGWNAPALAPWLAEAVERASLRAFGRGAALMGEGGSIPFMGMLGERFPEAQFVITGVLGPHSNAHGPNEFLDLPTARKISVAVASILADHAAQGAAAA